MPTETKPCGGKCPTTKERDPLHICGKCGSCLYEVGFKQDMEAAGPGLPDVLLWRVRVPSLLGLDLTSKT